jgi:hypothetical protein
MESSLCEKPERHAPRRLSDHLGLEGLKQKVHSLVDKVYSRSHVRKLFHQLDGWIVRRLWSHHAKRWRNTGWKHYPTKRLRGEEFKLIGLVSLIPSLQAAQAHP